MRRSEQFLREVQAVANLGYYVYDVQNDRWSSSEILDTIFGIDKDFPRDAAHWLELVSEDMREEMRNYLHSLLTEIVPFDCEYRIVRHNDGQGRWVHGLGKLQIDAHGNVLTLIGTIQDITDRKHAEFALRDERDRAEQAIIESLQAQNALHESNRALEERTQQAEASYRAKATFLAMMSHELRTPLNSIIGFSDLLRSQAAGLIGSLEYAEYADCIHSSGAQLLTIINDMLDIAKIDSGKMRIEAGNLNIVSLLTKCERSFHATAFQQGVALTSVVGDPQLTVYADERAIRQILFNLISNAIKFTRRDGYVVISGRAHLDGGAILSVADTGVGIPKAEISRILKPFEQVDNRFNRSSGGTGLGLSVVQGLISLHYGRLEIESTPGVGSTFTVWFPPPPSDDVQDGHAEGAQ